MSSAAVRAFRGEAAVVLSAGDYRTVFLPDLGMLGASLTWRGAELISLHGGVDAYRRRSSTGLPLLAPWANRLSRTRFRVASVDVDLNRQPIKRDPNGLPIHGTMSAQHGWEIKRLEPARLVTRFDYSTPELLAAFPFSHEIQIESRLSAAGLRVTTIVTPTGKRRVPISFGWHPYFRAAGPRSRWTLDAPAREHLELDRKGIPNGRSAPERAGRLAVGKVVLDDLYALGRDRRFTLSGGGCAVEVRFDAGYPYAQLFAPPGKPFVAIEPMTAPTNALVTGKCPIVKPGEHFAAAFSVSAAPRCDALRRD